MQKEDRKAVLVRLPLDEYELLTKAAKEERRSLNQYLINAGIERSKKKDMSQPA